MWILGPWLDTVLVSWDSLRPNTLLTAPGADVPLRVSLQCAHCALLPSTHRPSLWHLTLCFATQSLCCYDTASNDNRIIFSNQPSQCMHTARFLHHWAQQVIFQRVQPCTLQYKKALGVHLGQLPKLVWVRELWNTLVKWKKTQRFYNGFHWHARHPEMLGWNLLMSFVKLPSKRERIGKDWS